MRKFIWVMKYPNYDSIAINVNEIKSFETAQEENGEWQLIYNTKDGNKYAHFSNKVSQEDVDEEFGDFLDEMNGSDWEEFVEWKLKGIKDE